MPSMDAAEWFRGISWSYIPPERRGHLVPTCPSRPQLKLLGGSSKLAKLAEERRKKAAAAAAAAAEAPVTASGAFGSLDRLSRPKEPKETELPVAKPEPKRYPIRKKRDPTPPPPEPIPRAPEPEEERPDIRASPTEFGLTLSTSPSQCQSIPHVTIKDILSPGISSGPFKGPSPDDVVMRSQRNSRGLTN